MSYSEQLIVGDFAGLRELLRPSRQGADPGKADSCANIPIRLYMPKLGYAAAPARNGTTYVFFDIAIASGHSFETVRELLPQRSAQCEEKEERPSLLCISA